MLPGFSATTRIQAKWAISCLGSGFGVDIVCQTGLDLSHWCNEDDENGARWDIEGNLGPEVGGGDYYGSIMLNRTRSCKVI